MNTLRPKICGTKPCANLGQRAFTLIELLVVIAVTAVLFSLLIIPLISALRFNQQVQSVTASQDASRVTREGLTRELGSAVFVFDGTSHPFTIPAGTTISPGDDRYTNFLDLDIPGINGTGQYAPTVAHAYNAKLDFVLPKPSTTGTTDPTTGDQVTYRQSDNGSAIISSPALVFPPAPGTTMVRYWVGLKNPDAAYYNVRERLGTGNTNNTYILYRAQFSPYTITRDAGGNQTGIALNTDLFAPTTPNGNLPELDDPDFFRTVTTNDVNWLNSTHANYTATEMSDHNARVDNWIKIAKPVIPGPNVDLIALPHNTDNTLSYDKTGAFTGIAHSGAATDPVTGKMYPIVNTTVTFRPGTVSGDATPGTTASYTSQGAVAVGESGFGYTPTVYTTTSKSWSLPYHVSIYPANFNGINTADDRGVYYDTQLAPRSGAFTAGNGTVTVSVGDVMEYRHVGSADTTGTLVYDVTQGFAVQDTGSGYGVGSTNFVPMSINPDTGTINFAAASLPNGPADRYTRAWKYAPPPDGIVDLTQPTGGNGTVAESPLTNTYTEEDTTPPAITGVANAHMVPGSVRVFGPDQTPGPGFGMSVAYQELQPNSTNPNADPSDNQFSINYAKSRLRVKTDVGDPSLVGLSVIYEYQANMTLATPLDSSGKRIALSGDNPYQPMQVKVDYQTRDLIDVSLGVRIYDVTTNRAQILPSDTRIKIGNSNR